MDENIFTVYSLYIHCIFTVWSMHYCVTLGEKSSLRLKFLLSSGDLSMNSFSVYLCMRMHSVMLWLFVTLWTGAHQAPLSTGFPRQEYWSRLPFPTPGDLPNARIEPASPALAGRFFTSWATREMFIYKLINLYTIMFALFTRKPHRPPGAFQAQKHCPQQNPIRLQVCHLQGVGLCMAFFPLRETHTHSS